MRRWTSLVARSWGECRDRHTGADFLAYLNRVARGYRGHELHVILDNSSTHTTPAVQAWLTAHPHLHFHFTPKGASWLNLVEAWFSILTRKSVRRGSFETVRARIRHIERYLAEWNTQPTPFVWTKDPAAILKKTHGLSGLPRQRAAPARRFAGGEARLSDAMVPMSVRGVSLVYHRREGDV
jgi:transposase